MTTLRLVDPDRNEFNDELAAFRPAMLCSYVYLSQGFEERRRSEIMRSWSLDSGAFSAMTLGKTIDRHAYHDLAKELLATDPLLVEVFALDVIGDWRASLANTEAAWAEGIPAIPTFHVGEPEDALRVMARDYPKIALGGMVRYRRRLEWAEQCFARVWPKPIHGLGLSDVKAVLTLPFHSVDSSSWVTGPWKWGTWQTFGRLSVPGEKSMRGHIAWYMELERKARQRWASEMAALNTDLAAVGWRGVEPEVPV